MIAARDTLARASEIKFVVDARIGERLRAWARLHLEPDPHGSGSFGDEYDTSTLYFDTVRFDVFHRRGSFGRAKYRIRRYGSSDRVFLERKLRKPRVLLKRRTEVRIDELNRLGESTGEVAWAGDWFDRRLDARGLRPVCQLSYRRMARGAITSTGPARLTLDGCIHALPVSHVGFSSASGTIVLPDFLILELKYGACVPAVFKRLVDEFKLSPAPASKYRLAVANVHGLPLTALPAHTAEHLQRAYA
jgi:hypothetical protein